MQSSNLFTLSTLISAILASPASKSSSTQYVTKTMLSGKINPAATAVLESVQMIAPPPPPPAPLTTGPILNTRDGIYGDYEGFILAWHNVHRQNHSVPDMTYDNTLAEYAAILSSSCKYGHNQYVLPLYYRNIRTNNIPRTIGGGGYGQNIGALGSTDPTFTSRVPEREAAYTINFGWYNNEFQYYLPSYYGQPTPDLTNFDEYGHLTQVVWKGTTTVGCGTSYCPAGSIFAAPFPAWYTVCNYGPAGNVIGAFDTNVLPPQGAATILNLPNSI